MSTNIKNEKLIKGTLIYAIGSFGSKILSFLIVPLYTYYILPSDLGEYDLLMTTVALISPLITFKISDATYRWIINKKENEFRYISATYKVLIRNSVIISIIILILNYFIPIWNVKYFLLILIGDRILECLQKILRGLNNQKLFAFSGILHSVIFLSINFVKIYILKQGVDSILMSNVISLYLTIIFILIIEERLRIVNIFADYKKEEKEMLKYSAPLVPSALSWWMMSASDRYVIRFFLGSVANGIYSVSYKFPSILQIMFQMFNNSWTDMALSELKSGKETRSYVKNIFEELYKFAFSACLVLIPLTKLVMNVILSESYKIASVYVGFLYLGTVFQGFSSFASVGYLINKNTKGAAKTSVYGALINLFVNIILIKFIGLFAAAFSTFVGFFIMWLTRMHDVRNVFPIEINIKKFLPFLLMSICMSVVIIYTNSFFDVLLIMVSIILFVLSNKKMIKIILNKFFNKINNKRIKQNGHEK